MSIKHIVAGPMLAAAIAFFSPTYAGVLGGGAGGSLGGGLSGFGSHGLSGAGSLGSQGSFSSTLPRFSPNTVTGTEGKVAGKAGDASQSGKTTAASAASSADSKVAGAGSKATEGAADAGSGATPPARAMDAGKHALAGNGSVDAQHSSGSTSLSGGGSASSN